jgi:hypothetical protein
MSGVRAKETPGRKRPRTSFAWSGHDGSTFSQSTILKPVPKKEEFMECLQTGQCKLSDGTLIITCPMSLKHPDMTKCKNELKLLEVFEVECVTFDLVPSFQSSDVGPKLAEVEPTLWALWKPMSSINDVKSYVVYYEKIVTRSISRREA